MPLWGMLRQGWSFGGGCGSHTSPAITQASGLRAASWIGAVSVLCRVPCLPMSCTSAARPDDARGSQVQPDSRSSCACMLEHFAGWGRWIWHCASAPHLPAFQALSWSLPTPLPHSHFHAHSGACATAARSPFGPATQPDNLMHILIHPAIIPHLRSLLGSLPGAGLVNATSPSCTLSRIVTITVHAPHLESLPGAVLVHPTPCCPNPMQRHTLCELPMRTNTAPACLHACSHRRCTPA